MVFGGPQVPGNRLPFSFLENKTMSNQTNCNQSLGDHVVKTAATAATTAVVGALLGSLLGGPLGGVFGAKLGAAAGGACAMGGHGGS